MEKKEQEIKLCENRRKWAEHIKNCGEQNKSHAEYCREHGLSPKLFYCKRPTNRIYSMKESQAMMVSCAEA